VSWLRAGFSYRSAPNELFSEPGAREIVSAAAVPDLWTHHLVRVGRLVLGDDTAEGQAQWFEANRFQYHRGHHPSLHGGVGAPHTAVKARR